jgi:hypothetical protein
MIKNNKGWFIPWRKSCAKLVRFIEQKKYLPFLKYCNLAQFSLQWKHSVTQCLNYGKNPSKLRFHIKAKYFISSLKRNSLERFLK